MTMATAQLTRCAWCGEDPVYRAYHDDEWGVPLHDERSLFEQLCLEGQQAGLSWITVLKKRDHYRKRFHQFNIECVARMPDRSIEARLRDSGLIRNRLKLYAIRKNAQAVLNLYERGYTLNAFLWDFVDGKPVDNHFRAQSEVPANTTKSDAMSRALKRSGFCFVGTTICYALMQATGLVNDHLVSCYRHDRRTTH
ncbi:MAG: DNA-3-methyladenine glycosylase [Gammaproteobacteria bacterium]|nr:MAG: DNA-3-methyladenine glycosylase [Gammaproteobacteria bacterium]